MKKKAQSTVLVKWVRSGIGFPRRQKERVRSLGLRRLNQVVECPDTPHVRGLVASVAHLVEIVGEPAVPAWGDVPEYRIKPASAPPAESVASTAAEPTPAAVEESPSEASSVPAEASSAPAETSDAPAEAAPKKRSRTKKSAASSKSAEPSEPDEK